MADKEDSDIDKEDDTFSVVSQSKANIFGYILEICSKHEFVWI